MRIFETSVPISSAMTAETAAINSCRFGIDASVGAAGAADGTTTAGCVGFLPILEQIALINLQRIIMQSIQQRQYQDPNLKQNDMTFFVPPFLHYCFLKIFNLFILQRKGSNRNVKTHPKYRHYLQKSAIFRGNLSILKKYPNQIYHNIFLKILQSLLGQKTYMCVNFS